MPATSPRHDSCNGARRQLLQVALAAPALWVAGGLSRAEAVTAGGAAATQAARTLSLINMHTGESLVARYFTAGNYMAEALRRLNVLLRDHRSGESHPIDPHLFDVLYQVAARAQCEPRFEVISGYRSPVSNGMLRSSSSGVAFNSLHTQGKAIDVRLSGVPCKRLRNLALAMKRGGVGYYPKSDFVHLDTGRVRFWSG